MCCYVVRRYPIWRNFPVVRFWLDKWELGLAFQPVVTWTPNSHHPANPTLVSTTYCALHIILFSLRLKSIRYLAVYVTYVRVCVCCDFKRPWSNFRWPDEEKWRKIFSRLVVWAVTTATSATGFCDLWTVVVTVTVSHTVLLRRGRVSELSRTFFRRRPTFISSSDLKL